MKLTPGPPEQPKETPEEMDASIREGRRSVGARLLVETVRAAQAMGKTREQIDVEVGSLKEEYPRLYSMVADPKHSPAMLYAMLAQLEAIERGQKSTHDASVMVGTMLVNSYVRPKLGMEPAPLPDSRRK